MTATAERSTVLTRQLVVDSFVVPGPDRIEIDHYQIVLAPDASSDAPRTVLVTRDVAAYVFAGALEGTSARVNARGHWGQRNGKRVLALDSMEAVA